MTELENYVDNLATYNQIINLVNPNSRTDINQGIDYLTSRNQISNWIETAYATAVSSTYTDHIVTVGSCDTKYATTTILSNLQGEVVASLQSQF